MKKLSKAIILAFGTVSILSTQAFAGKKVLIYDDTETLGTGNYQNENYLIYKKDIEESEGNYTFNFTYGWNDKTDLAINIPFEYLKNYEDVHSDISDPSIEIKYRFFEKDNLKFAMKPFLGIPVKKDSDFSEGHFQYGITLVSQYEIEKWSFYANTSFVIHKEKLNENEFFQSFSAEYNISDNFSLIGTLYLSSYDETEKGGIIGFGYSFSKFEMGLGIGKVFNPENNYSIYAGFTIKFF
ncbi:hypothetical protein JCM14244_02440 [Venenivibrio stagnispumantis]|uniref:MetA-pathway of phenol degradation n=1 Tax=Venenivibrio stagnispumantis TaxID=407998 RepID=A0AA45WLI6_9AQUI|nr:transporter [Venenivibrio stagnispumantis]MCW4573276.1 transporter [Venenivibrio stagnispumantis]SMP11430.1 Putative MetA-pathway of phenol degradation [Venenivibrio stagnispumantis]